MRQKIPLSKTLWNKSLADIFGVYTEGDIVLLPKQEKKSKVEVGTIDISDLSSAQQKEYNALLVGNIPLYNI